MKRSPLLLSWAAAVVLPLGLAGCGDDDDDASADEPAAELADTGADEEVLEVVAVDYAFEGLPDAVDVGTRLTLRNDAPDELHELVAFLLPEDETRTVAEIMALPTEEMQQALGPAPEHVMLAPPSSDDTVFPLGDGKLRDEGRYAIICLIPTGVDPDEYLTAAATSAGPPDVGDGPPHIVHGMYAEVEVR